MTRTTISSMPVDLPRDRLQDEGKGLLLVEAGDLDDELHADLTRCAANERSKSRAAGPPGVLAKFERGGRSGASGAEPQCPPCRRRRSTRRCASAERAGMVPGGPALPRRASSSTPLTVSHDVGQHGRLDRGVRLLAPGDDGQPVDRGLRIPLLDDNPLRHEWVLEAARAYGDRPLPRRHRGRPAGVLAGPARRRSRPCRAG